MSNTPVFLPHLAGSCVIRGNTVHALFRVTGSAPTAELRVGSRIAESASAAVTGADRPEAG